ncbi:MAG: hypothetical protein ACE5HM_01295 [Acidiferrobacterales bacterium]
MKGQDGPASNPLDALMTDKWGVRGELERFEDVDDSDVDLVSASVAFRF